MRKSGLLLASMVVALLLLSGVALAATISCAVGQDYCVGTDNRDTINGTDERDRIYGLKGDDTLLANGGNDGLDGGEGKDTMEGGDGSDSFRGREGNDTMKGGAGEDHFGYSDPGADKLYGGSQEDTLYDESYNRRTQTDDRNVLSGGSGNDYLYGYTRLSGGGGNDSLRVGYAYKTTKTVLIGGPGLDRIAGEDSKDTIYAQDGERDTISCGSGADTVYFDEGIDSVNPINCEILNPAQ